MKPDNPGESPNPASGPAAVSSVRTDSGFPLLRHEVELRVRYQETDAQGHVHHTAYINYFEIGRIEMLRAAGFNYRDLEDDGLSLVVTQVGCEYFAPARYDDLLRMTTIVKRSRGTRIHHQYEIHREAERIVTGFTVVAALDPSGKVLRLPRWLQVR